MRLFPLIFLSRLSISLKPVEWNGMILCIQVWQREDSSVFSVSFHPPSHLSHHPWFLVFSLYLISLSPSHFCSFFLTRVVLPTTRRLLLRWNSSHLMWQTLRTRKAYLEKDQMQDDCRWKWDIFSSCSFQKFILTSSLEQKSCLLLL